ncbi:hypothetical protein C8035_v003101 [Colletotrichum spinosum]|uniref:Uncharacterized protein n=1 Tax=Colletotrichum spinosum TaxID=1347390 RepID=A0A4R8PWH7_9PEZI|nr:hypothetical protein C8035_v003101 [Colletotrichum spinosum]
MSSSSISTASVSSWPSAAVTFAPAGSTSSAGFLFDSTGTSPVPTQAPDLLLRKVGLPRRENIGNGCGSYYSSSATATPYHFQCGASQTCHTSAAFFGCEDDPITACYDGEAGECRGSVGPETLCCTASDVNNKPYCMRFQKVVNVETSLTMYACSHVLFPSLGTGITWMQPEGTIAATAASTSGDTIATTSSVSSPGDATETSEAGQTQTAEPHPASPIGPIVGGVVGGIALFCATILALVWLVVRRRRNTQEQRKSSVSRSPVEPPGGAPSHVAVPPASQQHFPYYQQDRQQYQNHDYLNSDAYRQPRRSATPVPHYTHELPAKEERRPAPAVHEMPAGH